MCYGLDAAQCRCRVAGCPAAPARCVPREPHGPARAEETRQCRPIPEPAPLRRRRTSSTSRSSSGPTTTGIPDPSNPLQAVAFGTSGHRGSSLSTTFNDDHIAATTQAIVEYRTREGTDGPLFVGADTHALSEPAWLDLRRGPGRERRHGARRRRGRLHPHARGVARDPRPQPQPRRRPRRRHRRSRPRTTRPRTAASSTTRRTAAPPTPTPRSGSPTGPTSCSPRSSTGCGAARSTAATLRTYDFLGRLRRRPARRRQPRRRSGTPACGSGPTRWAGPASPTGARSPSATGSTSPSSTRTSTRSSGS